MSFCNTAIDSLKIRIPEKLCSLTDQGKVIFENDKYIIDSTSGEIEEEFKKKAYKIPELLESGISLSIGKETISYQNFNTRQHIKTDFFTILLNSKILKSDYFQGITRHNIKSIYATIINLGLINFDFESFINSDITDIDIKTDFNIERKSLSDFIKEATKKLESGRLRDNKKAKSLSFGNRHNSDKIINNPYVKFYSKHYELMNNSNLFFDLYLKGLNTDYLRLEGAIKNKTHWAAILNSIKTPDKDLTLYNLLSMSSTDMIRILKYFLSKYNPAKQLTFFTGAELMSKKDQILFYGFKGVLKSGQTFKDYLKWLKHLYPEKEERSTLSRQRQKARKFYEILKEDPEMKSIIGNNEILNFLLT